MPTPRQHAKGALRSLRALINDLKAAEAEGVIISFYDEVDTNPQHHYFLDCVANLPSIVAANIAVRGAVSSTVIIPHDEADTPA